MGAVRAATDRVSRPLFHFTPERNWMNDPNGLVFHNGLWHVYFQYNPDGADWGNMSWGHATSADLRGWTEHPVALMHRDGEQIFSGSAVEVPGSDGEQLIAWFTSAYDDGRQAQSSASSSDGGYTWTFHPDNPLLDRGTSSFRDPKIVRFTDDDGTLRWIMLAVEAEERQVLFYSSEDLRTWEYLSSFGPLGDEGLVWECPDLVALPLDGDSNDMRWVLTLSTNPVGDDANPDGSSMSYVVGRFDGASFTAATERLRRLDHGRDFYAGVTFDRAPGGEPIMLGWMSNWRYAGDIPSTPWRGAMSLPRRLALYSIQGEPRLLQQPPAFIDELLADAVPVALPDATTPQTIELSAHSVLDLRWDPACTGSLLLRLQGDGGALVEVEHDPRSSRFRITRGGGDMLAVHADFASSATIEVETDGSARLLVSLDGPLLELFVGDGEATASNLVLLGDNDITALLHTERPGDIAVTAVGITERNPQ